MELPATIQSKLEEWYRVADWKNPKHYPSPKNASNNRWAWEFLRRNSEFINDTAEINKILSVHPWPKKGGALDHPAREAHRKLCEKWHIDIVFLHEWIANAPEKFDSPCRLKTSSVRNIWSTYRFPNDEREFHIIPKGDSQFLYPVNINWPIEPQIQMIKLHALANQNMWESNKRPKPMKQVRHHVNKFPFYLRVYDAFGSNVTAQEIAEYLNEENSNRRKISVKNIYEADEAARRFIFDHGYMFIPFTSSLKIRTPK